MLAMLALACYWSTWIVRALSPSASPSGLLAPSFAISYRSVVVAGAVGYKHVLGIDVKAGLLENDAKELKLEHPARGPVTIVTASSERIDCLGPIDVTDDLKFIGTSLGSVFDGLN